MGTAGRVRELLEEGELSLHICKVVCLDELDRSFLTELNRIFGFITHVHQTLLFHSALKGSLLEDLKEQLRDPVIINAAQRVRTRSDVKYAVEFMKSSEKNVFVVRNCLNQTAPPVLIVCRNEKNVDFLQEYFLLKGIDSVSITNARTPQEKDSALDAFREGKADVLICTDAALGDETIKEVNHVIHYDLPSDYAVFAERLHFLRSNGISTALVGSSAPQKAVVEMKLLLLKTGRKIPDWLQQVKDETGIPSVQSNRCLWCGSRNHYIVDCPQL